MNASAALGRTCVLLQDISPLAVAISVSSLGGELGKICRRLEIVGSQRCALSIGSGLLHGLRLSPISVSFFKRWQPDLG